MRLPILNGEKRYQKQIINFGGLNTTQNFFEGELSDCSGISHIAFPALTQRQKSEPVFECGFISAALFGNKECVAADDGLYYDRKKVGELSKGEKQLSYLGDKVVVFPDKACYDTKTGEFSSLEATSVLKEIDVTVTENTITVPDAKCFSESVIERLTFGKNEKTVTYETVTEKSNGTLIFGEFKVVEAENLSYDTIFCEKCEKNQYRRVISVEKEENADTVTVVNNLITYKNEMKDIFAGFRAGDVVEISGCRNKSENNKTATLTAVGKNTLTFAEGTFAATTENGGITVKRKIPDFSCVCSYENRLWGCEGNTIYASALGDPFNFFVYKKLSTDSFTVTSNTSGDFTACVAYGNYCLFFKENACYKLYGNKPSNFMLTQSNGCGIAKSERKSIAVFNGRLFYNGNGGIYSFYGGNPVSVSQKTERIVFKNSAGGCDGKRYYICADTADGREEYVYDIERGLWSKTGKKDATGYSYHGGQMYRFTKKAMEKIYEEADADALWEAEFCPFNESYAKRKNYLRLYITLTLFNDAWICVEEKSDGFLWRTIKKEYGTGKKYISIPFVSKSCHEIKIRLSGKGKCVIESMVREFSVN